MNGLSWYLEEDGHTYWRAHGVWVGAPTLLDGSVDEDNATAVRYMDLELEAREQLERRLANMEHRERGMSVYVYRNAAFGQGSTNGGASSHAHTIVVRHPGLPRLTLPTRDRPAFDLVERPHYGPFLRPADPGAGLGPMWGGNFAACSDSRWNELVRSLGWNGPVPIHDRWER